MLSNLDQLIEKAHKVSQINRSLFNERNRLREQVSTYESQLEASQKKLDSNEKKIEELNKKVTELQGFLESTQSIMTQEVKNLKDQNKVLQTAHDKDKATLNTWKEDLTSIRSRVAHVLENISNDVQEE